MPGWTRWARRDVLESGLAFAFYATVAVSVIWVMSLSARLDPVIAFWSGIAIAVTILAISIVLPLLVVGFREEWALNSGAARRTFGNIVIGGVVVLLLFVIGFQSILPMVEEPRTTSTVDITIDSAENVVEVRFVEGGKTEALLLVFSDDEDPPQGNQRWNGSMRVRLEGPRSDLVWVVNASPVVKNGSIVSTPSHPLRDGDCLKLIVFAEGGKTTNAVASRSGCV